MRLRALPGFVSVLMVCGTGTAAAQVSPATDIIVGRVIGPDSTPIAGAQVAVVAVMTNATKTLVTNGDGRFSVVFRDGDGTYRIQVTAIGMRPARAIVERRANQDRLAVTIQMSVQSQELSPVEVRGRVDPVESAFAAGGNERTLLPQLVERLQTNPGDLFTSATLVPGVIATAASDTSRSAFSFAAQPAVQNNITVDGMTFLFGSIPQDAVRSTRLILNAYDVSRGQFTGAQMATITKGGTSVFQGTANIVWRAIANYHRYCDGGGNRQNVHRGERVPHRGHLFSDMSRTLIPRIHRRSSRNTRRALRGIVPMGVALLSCNTFAPPDFGVSYINYGTVTVHVLASNIAVPPSGTDTIMVALDSAIQGAYLRPIGKAGDSVRFNAVLGGFHESTVRGLRAGCTARSFTLSDTNSVAGIDRTFTVENGFHTAIIYDVACPP